MNILRRQKFSKVKTNKTIQDQVCELVKKFISAEKERIKLVKKGNDYQTVSNSFTIMMANWKGYYTSVIDMIRNEYDVDLVHYLQKKEGSEKEYESNDVYFIKFATIINQYLDMERSFGAWEMKHSDSTILQDCGYFQMLCKLLNCWDDPVHEICKRITFLKKVNPLGYYSNIMLYPDQKESNCNIM